jgi:phosphoglycolate phosphatase
MSNPYQVFVFDWEGTISDTLGPILHIVATEADKLGFGELDFERAHYCADLGLVRALRKLFPHLTDTQQEQLQQEVQTAMVNRSVEVCLIPGVFEFILRAHHAGIDLAIATNRGHQSLMRALHASDLESYFKVTRSAGQVPPKPHPQMLQEIMDDLGSSPASTLMIGDSATDMEMAKTLNVQGIGVDFYHQQQQQLSDAGASRVFDDYRLLGDYLKLPTV